MHFKSLLNMLEFRPRQCRGRISGCGAEHAANEKSDIRLGGVGQSEGRFELAYVDGEAGFIPLFRVPGDISWRLARERGGNVIRCPGAGEALQIAGLHLVDWLNGEREA